MIATSESDPSCWYHIAPRNMHRLTDVLLRPPRSARVLKCRCRWQPTFLFRLDDSRSHVTRHLHITILPITCLSVAYIGVPRAVIWSTSPGAFRWYQGIAISPSPFRATTQRSFATSLWRFSVPDDQGRISAATKLRPLGKVATC